MGLFSHPVHDGLHLDVDLVLGRAELMVNLFELFGRGQNYGFRGGHVVDVLTRERNGSRTYKCCGLLVDTRPGEAIEHTAAPVECTRRVTVGGLKSTVAASARCLVLRDGRRTDGRTD